MQRRDKLLITYRYLKFHIDDANDDENMRAIWSKMSKRDYDYFRG